MKLPTRQEVANELAIRSFRQFVQQYWHKVDPAPFVPNWHIDAIAEHLQAMQALECRRLIINIPPGHAKSLLVAVLWPAWLWLHRPADKILGGCYAADLAVRDAAKSRALMESPEYRALVAHQWQQQRASLWDFQGDQNRKDWYRNTAHGQRIATSVTGKATGERADRIIVDDPLNALEGEYSEAARRQANAWISGTLTTRFSDAATGTAVVVMQRLHDMDVSGYLLAEGGWEHLRLPMEYQRHVKLGGVTVDAKAPNGLGFVDPREVEGTPLFEARTPPAELERIKRGLRHRYQGQYQQNPRAEGGNLIQESWFRRYAPEELPEKFDRVGLSVDANFGDGPNPDPVSIGVFGQKGPNHYLLMVTGGPWNFSTTVSRIRQVLTLYPEAALGPKLIEAKANGAATINTLSAEIPGIIAIKPTESKLARLLSCTLMFEAGNVLIPHRAGWVDSYMTEITGFPNALHDDQVDMTSQWLNWAGANSAQTYAVHTESSYSELDLEDDD